MKALRTAVMALAAAISVTALAEHVVILHTNDTHSQIDPLPDGTGGVLRRKALIDSIRGVEPNVMLVDAGDAVQGSLFFTFFNGEVEQKLLNALGYDIQILGNHEFDNGLASLKRQLDLATPELLATNYDFSETPLAGMFRPYAVRTFGDKKIGFFAVNINPDGLIDPAGYAGMDFLDPVDAANAMAWYLRHIEKVDKVVAVTHIGYENINGIDDVELARGSRDIDIIIGGHSHTLVDPASQQAHIANRDGRDVLVLQTRNKGSYLGQIDIDFDNGTQSARLLRVDSRLDDRLDPGVQAIIEPYRHKVDSIGAIVIGKSKTDFPQNSPRLLNLLSDFVLERGGELTGEPVDLAIMNKGGIRRSLPKGKITRGDIMDMLPFNNTIVVMELSGADLLENLGVMALQNGNGLSRGMDVTYVDGTDQILSATLNGKPVDPSATYRVATISYLAKGGDYMTPLTRGKIISQSPGVIFNDIIESMESGRLKGRTLTADDTLRMKPKKQ